MVLGKAVDVISVCSANGEIRPLRLRVEDDEHQLLRIDIDRILKEETVHHVGVEAKQFVCCATVMERQMFFELKYSIRAHVWRMRPIKY